MSRLSTPNASDAAVKQVTPGDWQGKADERGKGRVERERASASQPLPEPPGRQAERIGREEREIVHQQESADEHQEDPAGHVD
jgi:hypothetical protein